MLVIPEQSTDRRNLSRRELLRVGGSAVMGLSLAALLEARAKGAEAGGGPGWGRAKSILMIYLQGGPSQLDLWDPKEDLPDNLRSLYKTIRSVVPGMEVTELLPKLANVTNRLTFIRSMSYFPTGLVNHTAAMYESLTGYKADRVSPSGQLEPPTPKDFPHFGSHIVRLKPITAPMLPFVMLPRPVQESAVIGKGANAGFLGRAYDPYSLYPPGDDLDADKLDRIYADDLKLRPEISPRRLQRRARLRELINRGMPEVEKATAKFKLDEHYDTALELILSGRARDAFDLSKENKATRDRYGRNVFGQSLLLARRLIEAGTRVVEVNWPKSANADEDFSWDMHIKLPQRMSQAVPLVDTGVSALIADLDERGLLDETLVVVHSEFGRSPQRGVSVSGATQDAMGRDHWPYCYTSIVAGAGIKRGFVYGRSDATTSAPLENPVHPTDLLATLYHAVGIAPNTIVYNHLNQPVEMVRGQAITGLFG